MTENLIDYRYHGNTWPIAGVVISNRYLALAIFFDTLKLFQKYHFSKREWSYQNI